MSLKCHSILFCFCTRKSARCRIIVARICSLNCLRLLSGSRWAGVMYAIVDGYFFHTSARVVALRIRHFVGLCMSQLWPSHGLHKLRQGWSELTTMRTPKYVSIKNLLSYNYYFDDHKNVVGIAIAAQ